MLEAGENGLLNGTDLDATLDFMLKTARLGLIDAIDFGQREYWVVSVLKVDGDRMRRIVTLRADPRHEQVEGRAWLRGSGFVGVAWAQNREKIIADCNQPDVLEAYPIPLVDRREGDEARYRSIAVIPLRVGAGDAIWGMLAVSSDCVGRFRNDEDGRSTQNVDAVKLAAQIMEFVVAAHERGNRPLLAPLPEECKG